MNLLTKNRIIEKGDEFRHTDGRWIPVPDKNIGLQIMFSEYREVRRPTEQPPKTISPDSGATTAKAESNKQPVPSCSGTGTLPEAEAAASYLPTVVSAKAHLLPKKEEAPKAKSYAAYGHVRWNPKGESECIWIGRNGTFKAQAINLHRIRGGLYGDLIRIVPQGKRGAAKNALIEFPVSQIPHVIRALDALNHK